MAAQTSFAEEIALLEQRAHRFFSLLRCDADLRFAELNIVDAIRSVFLPKNNLIFSIGRDRAALGHDRQKFLGIKG